MNVLKKVLLVCAVSLSGLGHCVNAQVIDNGDYTTVNGLDWLDWSFTVGLTQQEAIDKFDKSGYGNKFRLAVHGEALAMLDEIYIDTYQKSVDNGHVIYISGRGNWNGEGIHWEGADRLLNESTGAAQFTVTFDKLFGSSNIPSYNGGTYRSYGTIDGKTYGVYDYDWIFGGGDSFNHQHSGIGLVRVAAPSTTFLFASLIIVMCLFRYKKRFFI